MEPIREVQASVAHAVGISAGNSACRASLRASLTLIGDQWRRADENRPYPDVRPAGEPWHRLVSGRSRASAGEAPARSRCCAAESPGHRCRAHRKLRPASGSSGRRSASSRSRAAAAAVCGWWRPMRSSRSMMCPRARRPLNRPRRRRQGPWPSSARCGFAAGSATASIGRFARRAPRRLSPRNISRRWRPRSTSARSAPNDSFDMVLGHDRDLLYAGLDRGASSDLQLVRWTANGRSQWLDAANADKPASVASATMLPVAGHITSYFGYRYHPILHFTRFHAGLDIGAGWGSPIVAAGDGEVVGAGWAGGYGRQVRIAHAGGLVSSYSHMSEIVGPAGQLRPCRAADRLCRLVRPLDRPAPPLRGQARRNPGQPARRALHQRAGGQHRARERGQGAAQGAA